MFNAKASSSDRRTVICHGKQETSATSATFSLAPGMEEVKPHQPETQWQTRRNNNYHNEAIYAYHNSCICTISLMQHIFRKRIFAMQFFLNVGPSELARVWTLKKLKTLWGKQCCHSWGIQTRAKHRSRLEQFRKHEVPMGVHFLKNGCMSSWTLSLSQLLSSTCFRRSFRLQLVWSHRAWRRDEGHGGKPTERKPDLEQLENIQKGLKCLTSAVNHYYAESSGF